MTAVEVFSFWVDGVPIPQGSKKGYIVGKTHVNIVDDNKDVLKPWRTLVAAQARAAYSGPQLLGALVIEIRFYMERPKTVTREYPCVKPDLDKLVRAIFDGITDSGAWKDDGQPCDLSTKKRYGIPGVRVRVGLLREGEGNE